MEQKKDRLKKIIKEKAVLKGDFVLSSGQKSNIYIDIKMVSGEGEFLDIASDIICDIAQKIGLYNFAGVELGGVPLVAAVVMKMHQRGFKSQGIIVRKNPKDYGTSKIIEGPKLTKVILLEDVITTGKTTLNAIEKLKENDIETQGVIAVIDRGGGQKVKEQGIFFEKIFSLDEIID
jgi:orotate phosphoribosyltransferase